MPPAMGRRPWHEHYDPQVPLEMEYPPGPIFEYLDQAARRVPKRPAVVFQNTSLDYATLQRLAETMAANLRNCGIGPGDRVALMLPNLPQTVIAYWAVLKAGAVGVMINPLYKEKELLHQVNDAGCAAMVCLDMLWPRIEPLRASLPVRTFIVTGIADGLGFPLNWLYRAKTLRDKSRPRVPYDGRRVRRFGPMLRGRERLSHPPAHPERDLALLQYTGGTTGVAKGVMLSHANLRSNVIQCRAMLHAIGKKHEVMLGLLPFFHIYGLTVCVNLTACIDATLVTVPRYAPTELLDIIHKRRPTIFPGAPSVYTSLLSQKNLARRDISCIDWCVSGSAPMPLEPMERFERMTGARIIEGYGLTEASPVTHLNPLRGLRKPGCIGLPFPDTDCRVTHLETRRDQPPGEPGELLIKGPQVMRGYWNRPEDTAESLQDGWLATGDVAVMDEDGYFRIVDRKKDMVIIGGYNVYPREIDEVLYEHPKVKEAVAVGVPHPTRGEIIKAFVVPEEGQTLEKTDITSWCRERLASYKVPRQVEFRDELPKTLVGKVLRRALREEEEAALVKRAAARAAKKEDA